MLRIAWRMLAADRAKFYGLLFGIAFTAFLVTFAGAYFCGFITQGFALVDENPAVDVWVMDPAVESVDQPTNLPDAALARVRGVTGVARATPMAIARADARLANGRVQAFEVIGVDDATLAGAPPTPGLAAGAWRLPDRVVVAAGGSEGKLGTPANAADRWPHGAPHLQAPLRDLDAGDELLVNDRLLRVLARAEAMPRFPPRPLLYATYGNVLRMLPPERRRLTFVLVRAAPGVDAAGLAARIAARTGLRARTAGQFREDTVRWLLVNSEDVGDIAAMLVLAMTMGFGVTGIMLYVFAFEHQRQFAVLKAIGAAPGTLARMVQAQAAGCALIGTGLGLGACALAGEAVIALGFPFRMLWFTPLLGIAGVLLVSATAAWISVRPVLRVPPAVVFAAR